MRDTTVNEERAIAVLREGTPLTTLRALATQWQMSGNELDSLLSRLEPALEQEPQSTLRRRISVEGDGPGTDEIAAVLRDEWTISDEDPDLVIIVAKYIAPLRAAGRRLRDDIPHVLVTFDERGASVGPLVIPGISPCAFCVDNLQRSRDTCWAAIVTQLMFTPAPRPATQLRFRVASEVARMAYQWGRGENRNGERVHLAQDIPLRSQDLGEHESWAVTLERVEFSDECQCRSL